MFHWVHIEEGLKGKATISICISSTSFILKGFNKIKRCIKHNDVYINSKIIDEYMETQITKLFHWLLSKFVDRFVQ